MKLTVAVECTTDELSAFSIDFIRQQLLAAFSPYLTQEFEKMSNDIKTAADKQDQERASNVELRTAVNNLVTNVGPLVTSVTSLISLADNLKKALDQAQQNAQSGVVMSAEDVATVQTMIANADSEIAANTNALTTVQQTIQQLTTLNQSTSDANTLDSLTN